MKSYVSFGLLGSVLGVVFFAVGCAAPTGDPAGTSDNAVSAATVPVTPGSFVLFNEPFHEANPECESFIKLDITANGQAQVMNGLGGRCAMVALYDPNPRSYTLTAKTDACGAKVYEGARRVALGPAVTGLATIKITDYRMMTCDADVAADIVVEETGAGPTTTWYSNSGASMPVERLLFSCREFTDHGATVNFYAGSNGQILRADYSETTIVETRTVSNMTRCEAAPSQPGADVQKLDTCTDVAWANTYTAELTRGGFTGVTMAKVYRSEVAGGKKDLLHTLGCQHVAN